MGHAAGPPSSTAGLQGPCPENEVVHASSAVLGKGSPARRAGLVLSAIILPRSWVPSPRRSLVASEPTPLSRTVAFRPTEVPGEMALVGKATIESDLYQLEFAFE